MGEGACLVLSVGFCTLLCNQTFENDKLTTRSRTEIRIDLHIFWDRRMKLVEEDILADFERVFHLINTNYRS